MSSWSYQALPELGDEQYARWQALLEERTGICFLQHKSILQKGLSQRMREVGADDYELYFEQVSSMPEGAVEWAQLVDRISVKDTRLFREPDSYAAVGRFLRQRLSVYDQTAGITRTRDYSLDIWSVGCSTGEEAYSLAIAANEVIDDVGADIFLGVMATDISQTALDVARTGTYSARKLAAVEPQLVAKYFRQNATSDYAVQASLKQRICFVKDNILAVNELPKMAMDIIFCQNVLVYFRKDRQRQVLDGLVGHLKTGGLLVIGPGEAMGWQHSRMKKTNDESVQAYIKY